MQQVGDALEVKFTREAGCEDLPLPIYQSQGAVGIDLPAAVDGEVSIQPGEFRLISTGLRVAIPDGFEGQVRPRSGLAAKYGVTVLNAPGTIDSDYRGVISVILCNFGKEPFKIRRGDRIAQMVFAPIVRANLTEVKQLKDTGRGEGGFGHTGI